MSRKKFTMRFGLDFCGTNINFFFPGLLLSVDFSHLSRIALNGIGKGRQ